MSDPGHQTVRYGTGAGPAPRPGIATDASVPFEQRDTAAQPTAGGLDETGPEGRGDDYRDDYRDDQWPPPVEPDHWQSQDEQDQWRATDEPATEEHAETPPNAVDDTTEFVRPAPVEDEGRRARVGPAAQRLASPAHTTGIWIGLVLAAAGFGAIFFTWTNVAGLTNVAQQMPYLVSGGISGLVLIIAGATVVDVAVRRRDSKERTEQLAQMTRALADVRELLEYEAEQREAESAPEQQAAESEPAQREAD